MNVSNNVFKKKFAGMIMLPAVLAMTACGGGEADTPAAVAEDTPATVTAEIAVNKTSLSPFSENGGSAVFSTALTSQPEGDVILDVTSTDTSEATADKTSLNFTAENWETAQVVTLSGVDDPNADGNQTFNILVKPNASSSSDYSSVSAKAISVTVQDDETAGMTFDLSGVTSLTESSSSTEFGVTLNVQPLGAVYVDISTSDATEAVFVEEQETVRLEFTPDDWNSAQAVRVYSQNDDIIDGNQTVAFNAVVSSDSSAEYADLADSLNIIVADDDTAGITVTGATLGSEPSVSNLSEVDGVATVNVRLNTQPSDDVVFQLGSSDPTEAVLDKASLIFTPANWNTPQTVTVTAQDDGTIDGRQPVTVTAQIDDEGTLDSDYLSLAAYQLIGNVDDKFKIVIFGTSQLYDGNLGGRSGADTICANDPSAPSGYESRAMLSVSNTDIMADLATKHSFPATGAEVVGPTGIKIHNDWTSMFDSNLIKSLNQASAGSGIQWTGSLSAGEYAILGGTEYSCEGWTNNQTGRGMTGEASYSSKLYYPQNAVAGCTGLRQFSCVAFVATTP